MKKHLQAIPAALSRWIVLYPCGLRQSTVHAVKCSKCLCKVSRSGRSAACTLQSTPSTIASVATMINMIEKEKKGKRSRQNKREKELKALEFDRTQPRTHRTLQMWSVGFRFQNALQINPWIYWHCKSWQKFSWLIRQIKINQMINRSITVETETALVRGEKRVLFLQDYYY